MSNKKQCYCPYCQRLVAAEVPTGISDGWGCLLTIVTGGLFFPLWIILYLVNSFARPMCPACGNQDLQTPGTGPGTMTPDLTPFQVVMVGIIAFAVVAIIFGAYR